LGRGNDSPCVSLTFMAADHILALLLIERDKLTAAIEALQGPTISEKTPGPGRKAALVSVAAVPAATPNVAPAKAGVPVKKGGLTHAGRKALSIAMKRRWAAKKKAAAK
jgi:hypothetical protein